MWRFEPGLLGCYCGALTTRLEARSPHMGYWLDVDSIDLYVQIVSVHIEKLRKDESKSHTHARRHRAKLRRGVAVAMAVPSQTRWDQTWCGFLPLKMVNDRSYGCSGVYASNDEELREFHESPLVMTGVTEVFAMSVSSPSDLWPSVAPLDAGWFGFRIRDKRMCRSNI
jgi:hypothetical protein